MHYKTLPVISNQVYNRYLKEIGEMIGVKGLSSHYGRRTFATLLYNKNVTMDAVAAALGDNVAIAAKYYAKVFDSTILNEQIKAIK
jgi:integrase